MLSHSRAPLQILLVWALLVCIAPGGLALEPNEQIKERARELLVRSDEQNQKDHSLAIRTATLALELSRELGDTAGIAQALAQIGQYHLAKGDLTEAKQAWEEALGLWRQQNDPSQQASTLTDLGYLEQNKGEWANAIGYYSQAQRLLGETGSPYALGRIASGLATIFIESGMPDNALTQYQRALDYYRQTGEERPINRMMMLIGYTYFLSDDHARALANLQEALSAFKPDSLDAAQCYEYLAQLHLANREHARALAHLEPSLRVYEKARNPIEAARVRSLMGQAYEQEGSTARARTSYLEALKTFRRVKDRVGEAAVSFALGRLELKSGNLDQAEDYLRRSIEHTEEIRSVSIGRDVATALSASVHNRYAAYIDCLIRKHNLEPAARWDIRAFEASEFARARSLAEFLRDTQTNLLSGVDPALAEQEKNLRQLIRAKIDARISLLATDYEQKHLTELEESLAALREQQQRLFEKIRALGASHEQITRPKNYSLSEIQGRVIENDETTIVEYMLGESASYAWVVKRNNIRVFALPDEQSIETAVGNVYGLLKTRPNKETRKHLDEAVAELSEMIIAPLAGELTTQRLIVVADGPLNYIPFQLLRGPAKQEPLIASFEIVNAPSASILGQLRQERTARPGREKMLAAFGDPAFPKGESPSLQAVRGIQHTGDSLEPDCGGSLFYAKRELNALKEIAGAQSLIVSGHEASRETFERTDLSKFAILHLATHGIFDPERPGFSGFCLSTVDANQSHVNGFMSVQDVYRLQAPVDLVVLSACRTALGKDVKGEGLIGLTRGFMHAGASSVAASLWNVDDEATWKLMKEFYANMLHKEMTPAAALRAAQNTIRQDPLWQEPHFWAAFTLQGEYNHQVRLPPPENTSRTNPLIPGTALILALLAAMSWWYWRRRTRRN